MTPLLRRPVRGDGRLNRKPRFSAGTSVPAEARMATADPPCSPIWRLSRGPAPRRRLARWYRHAAGGRAQAHLEPARGVPVAGVLGLVVGAGRRLSRHTLAHRRTGDGKPPVAAQRTSAARLARCCANASNGQQTFFFPPRQSRFTEQLATDLLTYAAREPFKSSTVATHEPSCDEGVGANRVEHLRHG